MLAASKAKMSGSETKMERRNTYDFFSITDVQLGRFTYVEVVQNNDKEMYKKMWCTCKLFFFALKPY